MNDKEKNKELRKLQNKKLHFNQVKENLIEVSFANMDLDEVSRKSIVDAVKVIEETETYVDHEINLFQQIKIED